MITLSTVRIVAHRPQRGSSYFPTTGRHLGWNEVRFLNVSEFASNAPAVLGLETARLTDVLGMMEPGSESYNEIIAARHSLVQLSRAVEGMTNDSLEPQLFELLEGSILRISLETGLGAGAGQGAGAEQSAGAVSARGTNAGQNAGAGQVPGPSAARISAELEYTANRLDYILTQMRRLA